MPYTADTVPDNVPKKYAAQFAEVWNSVYAAAKADKKSDADAESWAFMNAHGVVSKHKAADAKKRDVSSDGPGFSASAAGEKKSEDGGQVSDPTASLRFSEDQPRDPDGKFASGSQSSPHEADHVKQAGHDPKNLGQAPDIVTTNELAADHKLGTRVGDQVKSIFGSKGVVKGFVGDKIQVEHEGHLEYWHMSHIQRGASQISEIREQYMSIERRYAAELRVGAALGGNSQGEEMVIEGYAARFGQQSKDLGGFRETVAPGAFTKALASKPDVRCLFNHDASRVLGRTTSGTLTLAQDDKGLSFRCQLDPNQQAHRDLHAAIKRGDINECSFAFKPEGDDGDDWQDAKDERGNWFISRTLKNVRLFDVSAVTHPAYENTSVNARADEFLTPEIRSIMSNLVEKRVKKSVEKRDESVQEMLDCIRKCLAEKFPADSTTEAACQPCSSGKYWICDTYDDYVVASNYYNDGEYVKIPYAQNPDADGYVFGTPVPVEKEWVPTERSKSVVGEIRALKASHMQAIADAHAAEAASHKATADGHTAAADSHIDEAAAHKLAADAAAAEAGRMEKCSATMGDCEIKGCRCQNQLRKAHEVYYGDDENEPEDGEDEDQRSLKAARRIILRNALGITENRGGPGSGRHPGEGAKTAEEHKTAATAHEKSAESASGNGLLKEAAAHKDAASAHHEAAKAVTKSDDYKAAASKYTTETERVAAKSAHEKADNASAKAQAASAKANSLHESNRSQDDLNQETRDGDGNVRTKMVGGKSLSASAFAFVGDPNDTSTWKFPVHDADHARNALARWGQHKGIPADKEAGVYAKIVAAAKKFGIEVAETDAAKAARSNAENAEERMDKTIVKVLQAHAADKDTPLYKDLVTAVKGWMSKKGDMADNLDTVLAPKDDRSLQPLTSEEKEDLELRFKLSVLNTEF